MLARCVLRHLRGMEARSIPLWKEANILESRRGPFADPDLADPPELVARLPAQQRDGGAGLACRADNFLALCIVATVAGVALALWLAYLTPSLRQRQLEQFGSFVRRLSVGLVVQQVVARCCLQPGCPCT